MTASYGRRTVAGGNDERDSEMAVTLEPEYR